MNTKSSPKKAPKKTKSPAATNSVINGSPTEFKAGLLVAYGQVEGRLPIGLVIEPTDTPGVVLLVAETPQERKKRLAETRRLTLEVFQRTYENHQKQLRRKKTG